MTTRFAPVLPINFYPALDRGDYHLVQPHLFDNASDEAIQWFIDRGSRDPGHVVILDNGLMELGMADMEALPRVAELIKPDIIVVPDAFEDAKETMRLFEFFLASPEMLLDYCKAWMIVPHGRNVSEWCFTAYNMLEKIGQASIPFVVGIPKVLDKDQSLFLSGRGAALAWLRDLDPGLEAATHLLGVWEDLWHTLDTVRDFPKIAGMDTTLPFANALDGVCTYNKSMKSAIPDEWWMMPLDERKHLEVIWRAEVNIATTRHLLQKCSEQGARAVL